MMARRAHSLGSFLEIKGIEAPSEQLFDLMEGRVVELYVNGCQQAIDNTPWYNYTFPDWVEWLIVTDHKQTVGGNGDGP